ncbi:MAG: hypothetical protein JXB39_06885 [Deltaproteobacteria bacterium]|nr:hypothetical protein [Deltaproteobacteria bacterium]
MAPATPPDPPANAVADPWDALETGGALEDLPPGLRQAADRVVEHLCVLRGGGPFLSSVDARLLVGWLNEGVGPGLICTALERVAERRRRRRVKAPLALRSCRSEVTRLRAGVSDPRVPPAVREGASLPVKGDLADLARATLEALDRLSGGREARAEAAIDLVRRFHAAAWDAASSEHGALRATAAAELATFRQDMDPVEWEASVEEVARDLLRQRFPLLSASAVWDRLQGP